MKFKKNKYDLKKLNIQYNQMKYGTKIKQEVLLDGVFKNYQFYIMNLGTHPTAYVEIPNDNLLFKKHYMKLEANIDIDVHGGITYSTDHLNIGTNILRDSWFIGWDYAHFGDYSGRDSILLRELQGDGKKWTTEEIFNDVCCVIDQIIEVNNNAL